MPGSLLVEVVLTNLSGFAKDDVINTFAFSTPTDPPSTAEADDATNALIAFYNTVPSGHNAIAGVIGPTISRASLACFMKSYNIGGHLDGSPHGSPFRSIAWTLGAMVAGAKPLPTEVAAAITFHSDYGSDPEFAPGTRPRARDRGRVYIGPLTQSVVDNNAPVNRPFVSQSTRETLVTQAAALRDDSATTWCVWSRAAAALKAVTKIWVDDAFDSQRRRGEKATVFTTNP